MQLNPTGHTDIETAIVPLRRKKMVTALLSYGESSSGPRTRQERRARVENENILERAKLALEYSPNVPDAIALAARRPSRYPATKEILCREGGKIRNSLDSRERTMKLPANTAQHGMCHYSGKNN